MAGKKQSTAAVRSVVLILCAMFIAWGLHGRLSGYNAPNQSHPKSIVKLMQEDQTRRLAASAPIAAGGPFPDFADLAAVHSQLRLMAGRIQQVRKAAPDSAPYLAYALRFRPPPLTI